jgi:hypothetical protein
MKVARAGLTIKTAPWQVVWFSIGLYIVVYGLKNAGLTEYFTLNFTRFSYARGFYSDSWNWVYQCLFECYYEQYANGDDYGYSFKLM